MPCIYIKVNTVIIALVSKMHLLYLAVWICKHPCEDLTKSFELHTAAYYRKYQKQIRSTISKRINIHFVIKYRINVIEHKLLHLKRTSS